MQIDPFFENQEECNQQRRQSLFRASGASKHAVTDH
jgi:hypothetical protein